MIDAISHLHDKGFCHRDLKPENILLDEFNNLKICDFGFSSLIEGKNRNQVLTTYNGTAGYRAPEITIHGTPYSGVSADVFSLGVILFILVVGKPPFG